LNLKNLESRTKTNYMEFEFSKMVGRNEYKLYIDGQEIGGSTQFHYLGSIIHQDVGIEEDVIYKIKARYFKWRSTSGVLCGHGMLAKLKENL